MDRSAQARIRHAVATDIPSMTLIYAHHVMHGTGSFEEDAPSESVMHERWQTRDQAGYPTLIAELNDNTMGFAYAGNYKSRSAYRFTVEDSIYVSPDFVGQGVGLSLLETLIAECQQRGYRQMMAVIGDSQNTASIGLHKRCGFKQLGTAKGLGYKFDRWLDIVYMQRALIEPTLETESQ